MNYYHCWCSNWTILHLCHLREWEVLIPMLKPHLCWLREWEVLIPTLKPHLCCLKEWEVLIPTLRLAWAEGVNGGSYYHYCLQRVEKMKKRVEEAWTG